jgi:DNA repair protein SbcD/Mre11
MKILHTADWHLGDRLGRIDRTLDLRRAVERVADYCTRERIDVLLVAGDLFSEITRPDGLREAIHHWKNTFQPFLESGGTLLTLTGNHDNENFCQTLVHAMTLAAPTACGMGEVIAPGRLYLATEPTFVRLQDRESGSNVQFVLMPWPTPSRYLRGQPNLNYGSPEEKNQLLVDAWSRALCDIRGLPSYDPQAPAVLAAHINMVGAHIGPSLFRLTPQEDLVIDGKDLADQFDYVALGHIHKAQDVGAPHVRYCGSIERMDLGEGGDSKSITIVEIGPDGLTGEPALMPMPSTAIYEEAVLQPASDLDRLRRERLDASTALVNLHVKYTAGVDQLEDVLRGLDEIFPRWYARDWEETGALGPSLAAPDDPRSKGFRETVREYLEQELIQHDDADRDAILALADELLDNTDR